MTEINIHATERYIGGRPSCDPRAIRGTLPGLPRSKVEDRMAMWSAVLRGWCPVLLGASSLIRLADDVTRVMSP